MIRRDYILRLVAEMVQVLARVLALKSRREYDEALREVDAALRQLREGDSCGSGCTALSLEEWIGLCRKHEQAASGLMVAVADLLKEQGDLFVLRQRPADGHRSKAVALGLLLEALMSGETFVSAELLTKVDQLLDSTRSGPLEAGVSRRLVHYFVARGRYAKAEDALFDWLTSGDRAASSEGLAFYDRLLALNDAELERGALPRAEVEDGKRELIARLRVDASRGAA